MRTFRVETTIPIEGVGNPTVTVATEVFAEEGEAEAHDAGATARDAMDAFIYGFTDKDRE